MIVFLMIILYVLICNYIGDIGINRKIGFKRAFWINIILTPIIGILFTIKSRKLTNNELIINSIKETNFVTYNRLNVNMTEIVRILLAINLLMFIVEVILITYDQMPYLDTIILNSEIKQSYQFITYQFLHSGISHLFNNMFVLVMCGPVVERYYGKLKFILWYLIFGIFGALLQIYYNDPGKIIGASASVFGILTLFALVDKSFLKIGKYKIRFRIFAYLMIVQEIYETLKFENDKIGHLAHIGGGITAVLFFIIYHYATKIKRSKEIS